MVSVVGFRFEEHYVLMGCRDGKDDGMFVQKNLRNQSFNRATLIGPNGGVLKLKLPAAKFT